LLDDFVSLRCTSSFSLFLGDQLVAQQGELIERIDSNTEAALGNIGEAHSQISRYQRTISGNRGLIVKTFAVLFFVIIVYGTLVR